MSRIALGAAVGVLSVLIAGCGRHGGTASAQHLAAAAQSPRGDVERGRALYRQQCEACHGASGVDGPVGPALRDERSRMRFEEVVRIIKDPQPPMPKLFPGTLDNRDVIDITAYVESL